MGNAAFSTIFLPNDFQRDLNSCSIRRKVEEKVCYSRPYNWRLIKFEFVNFWRKKENVVEIFGRLRACGATVFIITATL